MIGLAGGLNRYAYVGANPMNWIDPTGEFSTPWDLSNGAGRGFYLFHIMRNTKNIGLPCTPEDARLLGWKDMPFSKNIFHIFPTNTLWNDLGNKKWVSDDGRREVIFDRFGKRVSNPINAGSYNYRSPDDFWGHTLLDVIPWMIYGNGPSLVEDDCNCLKASSAFSLGLRGPIL